MYVFIIYNVYRYTGYNITVLLIINTIPDLNLCSNLCKDYAILILKVTCKHLIDPYTRF
jgi:uncharacterized membrane protein